jgi:hypothetical protein
MGNRVAGKVALVTGAARAGGGPARYITARELAPEAGVTAC